MSRRRVVPDCQSVLRLGGLLGLGLLFAGLVSAAEPTARNANPPQKQAASTSRQSAFRVPAGFVVEKVAGPPLVNYPLLACFDDHGRLYVAEGTGLNLPGHELLKLKRGRITLLEDTDGDGRYDSSKLFADRLVYPAGVLWHDGVVYATSPPNLWRFEDTDGDGRADRREVLVGEFDFTANGASIHGPFFGPDGRIYWTDGRHGYKVKTREGTLLEGLAPRVWRCRPDGTQIERVSGAGIDNPIEIAFTSEGEMIGTVSLTSGLGDGLLHFVEGGAYVGRHECQKELIRTGPLLEPVSQFPGFVTLALCGVNRCRSIEFGPEYRHTFFTAQFNVHRVQQHIVERIGATYRGIEHRDFLVSTDHDFHPSEVLEDADGSLLVIDMGAWYNYGCPISKIAKPEVKGAIYRVRRRGAHRVADPWGKSLKWAEMSTTRVTSLLDDPRARVRDKAVARLAKLGSAAVRAVAEVSRSDGPSRKTGPAGSVQARRNAVWALSRIGTPEARAAMRDALADKDLSVRLAAAHCVGLLSDAQAGPALLSMVVEDEPPLRLKAAEALGRIGRPEAVPALLGSLRRGSSGRFLEHSLIYALIRIGDRSATLSALEDPSPLVRRAGLLALDQMKDGRLTRDLVAPLLDTDDPDLQQTALDVISRHEGWSDEILGLLGEWVGPATLSDAQRRSLTGALLAFCDEQNIQRLVADALAKPETPIEKRLLLLHVVARCRLDRLPEQWLEALRRALGQTDLRVLSETVATVRSRNLTRFDEQLAQLSRQDRLPAELRIAALGCIVSRQKRLAPESFALLTSQLKEDAEPLLQVAAARALGTSSLDRQRLMQLTAYVTDAGPLLVPLLVPAFAKSNQAELGLKLVAALGKSPGADALTADDLNQLLKAYPSQVRTAAQSLLDKLTAREQQQRDYLAAVRLQLVDQPPGNPAQGRKVFFSNKVGCYGCHRIGGRGGTAGPDLSKIGRIRSPSDLLEAIVFPSSTMAQEYRPYLILSENGRVFTGIIVRESSQAVYLRTAELAEIRIPRHDVQAMKQSAVSIMPQGLEKTMTAQELNDLLEFLSQQR